MFDVGFWELSIIALVALFRPGPLQSGMVDNFIDRKNGRQLDNQQRMKLEEFSLAEALKAGGYQTGFVVHCMDRGLYWRVLRPHRNNQKRNKQDTIHN